MHLPVFFSLLRAGLYGVPVPEGELPAPIPWKEVLTLARKHAVLGIIIDSVAFVPEHLRPSADTLARMRTFALQLLRRNLAIDRAAARLAAFLRANGIDGVLLKGQGVARYYRQPEMRQTGDVDFYVGKSLYDKALALCADELVGRDNIRYDNEQHAGFYLDGVLIELHRLASRVYLPFAASRFSRWVVDELEHSPRRRSFTVGDTAIPVPSYDFDAIFIFYHAWRHYVMEGGVGLRQLCDWAMIFRSHVADIDTPALVHNIRRFGMTRGWKLFAWIAVNRLGVPAADMPLYDPAVERKARRVLADIVTGGNFGRYAESSTGAPVEARSIRDGLGKVRTATRNLITFFPLVPAESTFIYIHYIYDGTKSFLRRK